MTPARAAFNTLIQCRPLWIWHFWGLAVCVAPIVFPLAKPEYREGALTGMLLIPFWSGVLSASVCRDFLSKPFAFAVPHHPAVWRRTLFSIGLVVAALCALVFLLVYTGASGTAIVSVWQAFLVYLAVFATGVLIITASPNPTFLPGVLMVMVFVVFSDNFGPQFRASMERALLANPLVTTVTCAFIVAAGWRRLGSRGFARRVCGEAFLPLHGLWSGNRQAVYAADRKIKQLRKTPGVLMRAVERFFLTRMRALAGHSTARSLLGTLYILVGKAAPVKASNLIAAVIGLMVLAVVLGFYHPRRFPDHFSVANLVMFLICALNAEYRINPYAALMLNISRKNRFRSLLFAALAQTVVVMILAAVITAVSIAVGAFLDQVTVFGHTWNYDPIVPQAFFFFAPLLPFLFICQVLFPKNNVIPITVVSIAGILIFIANAQRMLAAGPLELALLQLVCWLPFVMFIRHYCYSWDLKLDGQ
jgi:hypothetical protein